MKRVYQMLFVALLAVSCNKDAKNGEGSADTAKGADAAAEKTETPKVAYVFNEADWVETDLSTINKNYPILVKLPKTAKIGPSEVDPEALTVTINEETGIDISTIFYATTEEAITGFKGQEGVNDGKDRKLIKEDKEGFFYEELATEGYDAQFRFWIVLKAKGEGCFTFRNHATGAIPGTKEAAEKMYEAIRSSAKLK